MEQIRCIRKPTQICPDTCPLQIVEKVREALTDYPARNAVRRSSQRKLIRQGLGLDGQKCAIPKADK